MFDYTEVTDMTVTDMTVDDMTTITSNLHEISLKILVFIYRC